MGKTLVESMLLLAKIMSNVYEGVSTATGTTTTLIDADNVLPTEQFAGGTLFLLSGTYSGECRDVKSFAAGKFTVQKAFTGIVATAINYAAVDKTFQRNALKQAINFVLDTTDLLKFNSTLIVAGTDEYTLPTDVFNVKRIEVAGSNTPPYQYQINQFWEEINGNILFSPGREPNDTGAVLRVSYVGKHGAIEETGATNKLNDGIDINWLLWSAAAYLWRRYLQNVRKDNPTAIELLNEAKTNEMRAMMELNRYPLKTMRRDIRLGRW